MGLREMQGARQRTVTEGKKLSPFAQAYFKLWRANAGMGEMNDVEALEKQCLDGEVTDAELLKNAPKKWRGKLPPLKAEAMETPAGNFGFSEELAQDVALEKLLGHNFIDDGKLLEQDGTDPGSQIRSRLAAMDGLAMEIRKGLNALVREGIGMVEEAATVDLGEGTATLAAMKPVLGRLMTSYTELVSGLQKARESVGYEVEGPSVTTVSDEGEMQERITRNFARHATRRYAR